MIRPGSVGWAGEWPPGFVAETLATNMNAVTALAASSDGRIFIAEQTGALLVWKNGRLLDRPVLNLAERLDTYWERGLIGLVLSPAFPREPHLYALYVAKKPFVHHVLARFTINGDELEPDSEQILLEGDDQATLGGNVPAGHQGGILRFGADHKLYIGLGEQTAGEPAQRLDTFQGKILRLNADGSIPSDNPFYTKTAGKYRAIYAIGIRNPFGLAAQSLAEGGRMFFTDVGASAFEEVNELRAGANYGWPRVEGFSTNAAFENPLHAYPPTLGQSIIGGVFVPRHSSWPDKWRGRFLYGDFMKHWLRALDPLAPTNILTFARHLNGPVATEWAPDGSLLVLNRGAVWRDPKKFVANAGSLVRIRSTEARPVGGTPRPAPSERRSFATALDLPLESEKLPRRMSLSDWNRRTGLGPARAFRVFDGEWQPFMRVRAQVFLPSSGQVRLAGPGSGELVFPPGTVFVREFSFNAAGPGGAPMVRPVERRLLTIGETEAYGVSYRLDAEGNGELIEDGEPATLGWGRQAEKSDSPKTQVTQVTWWFPSLEPRLSRPISNPMYWIPSTVAEWNQRVDGAAQPPLNELRRTRILEWDMEPAPAELSVSVDWRSSEAPVEARVRAYLHTHCAACHQPGGASRGLFDARLTMPLPQAGILNGALASGDLGIIDARVVVPGSPEKSVLLRRLKDTGFFRMPPAQVHNELSPIIPVVEEWIRSLK